MNIKLLYKSCFYITLITLLAFTVGCGGGGGGGGIAGPGTDYNPTSVVAPNTLSTLNTTAASYTYSSTAANVAVNIPVNNEAVKFALTVTNTGNSAQTVNVKPESYVFASIREDSGVRASVVDDLDEIRIRQMAVQAKFREEFVNSMRQNSRNLLARKSFRASDHRGEVLNQLVDLRIIADGGGYSYQTINCKLVKITDHCKFFVDQGTSGGLSAVTGEYKITTEDIEHFAYEFETHIHKLMTENYGPVYDIDQDGRLSVVFSPVYAKIGYAGLFNSIDLNPTSPSDSNQRDLIALWSPNGTKWVGETWREATRETIAHEMQHIINMSAKVYPNNTLRTPAPSNYDNWLEEPWLDESLSVGCEVRYRLLRGDNARENRFDSWASKPSIVAMNFFSYYISDYAFEHYGQKGLFNFYLLGRYGSGKIQKLSQTTNVGIANLEEVYGVNFTTLVKNFSLATINESLRHKGLINVSSIPADYKFTYDYDKSLALNIASKDMNYGQSAGALTIGANATAYYVITQPAGFADSEYRFRIESNEGQPIEIMMMRLPNP